MNLSEEDHDTLWERFDQLAGLPEDQRQDVYLAEGRAFLDSLVSRLTNYALPKIDSAADFSDAIVSLRGNYCQWNQRLCALITSVHSENPVSKQRDLVEFANTCPWIGLADVARNV